MPFLIPSMMELRALERIPRMGGYDGAMREVYIVSATRTPIGRFGGVLKDVSPVDLGAHAMRAALERAGVEGKDLDLYVFGNVLRAGHGQLLPR
ncbi:thiolase family protein, partial [Fervidobacterium sp.]